jgi:ribosome-associated protein
MKKQSWHDEPERDPAHPSKSQIKRELLALQEFGLELLKIQPRRLDAIEMDDRLRAAIAELRRLTSHSARRRQVQYVGKLLRDVDLDPFRRALAASR